MWIHSRARWSYFSTLLLALCISAAVGPPLSMANEMLRIAGMGGTRIATSAEDAGIFGNPASLVHVKHHNFALGITAENIHWTELPKHGTIQFVAEANADISPTLYYSHAFGKWGASAGYTARFTNFANFTLESTRAAYNRNSRQFSATTDLFTRYDLRQDRSWVIGFSRELRKSAVGLRLRLLRQVVNSGTAISTLNLEARHGPEVDVGAPEELIRALVEELQFGDRVRDIVHERRPTLERTVNRFELDIGFQRRIWFDTPQANPPLLVGVLFENLLRADLVEPLPFRAGIGIAYEPFGMDYSRSRSLAGLWAKGNKFCRWQRISENMAQSGPENCSTPNRHETYTCNFRFFSRYGTQAWNDVFRIHPDARRFHL